MVSHGIPLDKAELLSTLLEGILYGFSLLMFGGTICQLFYRRRCTGKLNYKMIMAACLLLLCSTAHLIIDIVRIMEGLIIYRDREGGPESFFATVSQWTFVSKNYIYAAQTLIGDAVVLYRCYVVWQSKLVMIIPVLLWMAAGVTGFGCAYIASQLTGGESVFCHILLQWIKAFYATAFVTNVLTTVLLAYRVWDLDQRVVELRGHSESYMRDIMRTILDAGAIYSITLFVLMICYSMESNGQFVVLDVIVPIISITFYMVIIRVGLLNSNRSSHQNNDLPRGNIYATATSFCAETRSKQVRTVSMSETKASEYPRSPISPVVADDEESRRYQSETSLGDSGDAV